MIPSDGPGKIIHQLANDNFGRIHERNALIDTFISAIKKIRVCHKLRQNSSQERAHGSVDFRILFSDNVIADITPKI